MLSGVFISLQYSV